MPRTIAIIYGLNEGPAHGKLLLQMAAAKGFVPTQDASKADVVVTHSGGCYFVDELQSQQTILLTNPVCGRYRRLPIVLAEKILIDCVYMLRAGKWKQWLRKTLWNGIYIVGRGRQNLQMIYAARQFRSRLPDITAGRVIVVNNQADPWAYCVPQRTIQDHPGYTYLALRGSHDDLWIHPEKYLDIVQ